MGKMIDYAGKELNYTGNCPSCAYASGEFEITCGRVYEDDICIINQDWETPVNGFMIIASKRHVEFLEEFTEEERNHIFEMVSKVTSILHKKKIVKNFNVIFEEKEGYHFHIWLMPRDGWREMGIHPTKEIAKVFAYAKENLRSKENLDKIMETVKILRKELNKK